MVQKPEIQLLRGFCGLPFGSGIDKAVAQFGDPEEVQELNDDILNNNSIVYHYWNQGFSLFFDLNRGKTFCSVELDNRDTMLFGIRIFSLREKEVIQLMLQNNYQLTDTEVHQWGEKRVSFDSAGLDCYYENNRMVSLNFGILEQDNQIYFFPN